MESKQVSEAGSLLEFLMEHGQYSTRTRARNAVKAGVVAVDGKPLRIPSAQVEAGQTVTWTAMQSAKDTKGAKDFNLTPASNPGGKAAKSPYEVVYEDENILAYIKPAGMVFASPKPQVKTSFTAMKNWMAQARPKCECIQFVNRIEKESSGISLIAKNLVWRKYLQTKWPEFQRRLYVLVEGHLPPDDVLFCFENEEGKKKRTKHEFAYRTMRATVTHTLLKMDAGFEHVPMLMSGLRRQQCILIGKGKEMPDPLGRSGLHLFGVDVIGPNGEEISIKSRVPQPFLNLMKGGKGPKAEPQWKRKQREQNQEQKKRHQ
jgi:23S rRNA-/tRNA-specific pseudouridylate synthase